LQRRPAQRTSRRESSYGPSYPASFSAVILPKCQGVDTTREVHQRHEKVANLERDAWAGGVRIDEVQRISNGARTSLLAANRAPRAMSLFAAIGREAARNRVACATDRRSDGPQAGGWDEGRRLRSIIPPGVTCVVLGVVARLDDCAFGLIVQSRCRESSPPAALRVSAACRAPHIHGLGTLPATQAVVARRRLCWVDMSLTLRACTSIRMSVVPPGSMIDTSRGDCMTIRATRDI
jgi:hypothetical protein